MKKIPDFISIQRHKNLQITKKHSNFSLPSDFTVKNKKTIGSWLKGPNNEKNNKKTRNLYSKALQKLKTSASFSLQHAKKAKFPRFESRQKRSVFINKKKAATMICKAKHFE